MKPCLHPRHSRLMATGTHKATEAQRHREGSIIRMNCTVSQWLCGYLLLASTKRNRTTHEVSHFPMCLAAFLPLGLSASRRLSALRAFVQFRIPAFRLGQPSGCPDIV